MKKTLITLFAVAFAGLIGTTYAAEGGAPAPAAAQGQEQKAQAQEKKAEKKATKKKEHKKEKKQIHKKDTSAAPATPAEPAKK